MPRVDSCYWVASSERDSRPRDLCRQGERLSENRRHSANRDAKNATAVDVSSAFAPCRADASCVSLLVVVLCTRHNKHNTKLGANEKRPPAHLKPRSRLPWHSRCKPPLRTLPTLAHAAPLPTSSRANKLLLRCCCRRSLLIIRSVTPAALTRPAQLSLFSRHFAPMRPVRLPPRRESRRWQKATDR